MVETKDEHRYNFTPFPHPLKIVNGPLLYYNTLRQLLIQPRSKEIEPPINLLA